MGVDEVGSARGSPRRKREGGEEERQRKRLPRCGSEVVEDPVAVRDPEVAEVAGRDDANLDARRADGLDCVSDEVSRDVTRVLRIRGREDEDSHSRARCCASAAGAAIMSSAST